MSSRQNLGTKKKGDADLSASPPNGRLAFASAASPPQRNLTLSIRSGHIKLWCSIKNRFVEGSTRQKALGT
jgi:hypothetical protein